jgi:hypothetical protein
VGVIVLVRVTVNVAVSVGGSRVRVGVSVRGCAGKGMLSAEQAASSSPNPSGSQNFIFCIPYLNLKTERAALALSVFLRTIAKDDIDNLLLHKD